MAFPSDVESSEDTHTLTASARSYLNPSNTLVLSAPSQVQSFLASEYSGTQFWALDAANAQAFINGQAYRGYQLNPDGKVGLSYINLPAGTWYIGVYNPTLTGTQTTVTYNELSAVSFPGEVFQNNVPMAVNGNPGAWRSQGFTITGNPDLYIETEGTGGKFMIMNPSQYQAFSSAYGNGFFGGTYSYTYALGGTSGGPDTEIEGQLKLSPGTWYLLWLNDSQTWQGGAGNISAFGSGTGGNSLATVPTDTTAPSLIATSPPDGATAVDTAANFVLTFDEAVRAGTGAIQIHNKDGSLAANISVSDTSQVTFSANSVVVNPSSDLSAGVHYITIAAGVVMDLAGNSFAGIGSTGFDFTVARFKATSNVSVANFAVNAGGWSSEDKYPRHVADVNGDGYADIVGFGQAGTLVSYGSASGTFSAPVTAVANFGQTQGWSSDNAFHRQLIDVNRDGRADIVGFGIGGVLVSIAQADGSFAAPKLGSTNFNQANGWSSEDAFTRTLADVNGDGFADVVGFGIAGTFVALGKGDGTFGAANFALANFGANQGWTSDNNFHRTVADVNGDGRADVIGFGIAGTLVALGQANGTFGAPTLAQANFGTSQGWSTQDAFARVAGDVNGDGKADVVGFGIAGTYVSYGQADGSFSAAAFDVANFGANQGWTSDNILHRELADVNNDKRADVVGFGFNGVFVSTAVGG